MGRTISHGQARLVRTLSTDHVVQCEEHHDTIQQLEEELTASEREVAQLKSVIASLRAPSPSPQPETPERPR
jgi:hypothetical protein